MCDPAHGIKLEIYVISWPINLESVFFDSKTSKNAFYCEREARKTDFFSICPFLGVCNPEIVVFYGLSATKNVFFGISKTLQNAFF